MPRIQTRQHPLQQPMFDAWESLVEMVSSTRTRSALPKFGAPERTEGGLGPTVAELQQTHPEGVITSPPERSQRFGDVGFGSANVENIMSLLGEMIRPVDAASGLTESLTDVGLNPLSMGAGAIVKMGRGRILSELGGLKEKTSEKLVKGAIEEAGDAPAGSRAYLATRELQSKASSSDKTLANIESGRTFKSGKSAEERSLTAFEKERAAREAAQREVLDEKDFLVFDSRKRDRLALQKQIGQPVSPEFGRPSFPRNRPGRPELFANPLGREGRFPEGGRGDIALPHGATSDGMSNASRRARMDGRRFATSEEMESWVDFVYADQGKKMPDSTRRVLQAREPEEIFETTLRAIREGDITGEARKWYRLFNRTVKDIVGEANVAEFANVWAALSPQKLVETNLRDAFSAMRFAREYTAAIKKAGREFDVEEFAQAFGAMLRRGDPKKPAAMPRPFTLLGKLGKGRKGATSFRFRGNLRPLKGKEGEVLPGTQIEGLMTSTDVARKIGEFYKTGVIEGDLKIKSFSMTTAMVDALGGAATATNDVRVGKFFGFKNMVEGDGYLAIQHLAAETARELSNVLKYRVTTDEVQAIWWFFGASAEGTAKARARLGKKWPHEFGTMESALAFAMPEIEEFKKLGMPTDEAFVKTINRNPLQKGRNPFPYAIARQKEGASGFPMNPQMQTTMTGEQLKDMPVAEFVEPTVTEQEKKTAAALMKRLSKLSAAKVGQLK